MDAPEKLSDCGAKYETGADVWACCHHHDGQHIATCDRDPGGAERILARWPIEPAEAAPSNVSDADIAREFFRRFGPIQVHVGEWRGRAAVAELDDDDIWIAEMLPDGSKREEYGTGEDGFVAAMDGARALAKGSGR